MVDAAVVGAGPNGLAAAVTMARAGLSVRVYEAAGTPGGGARTSELIQPGYLHDICSAVHPMALASPFFREFKLDERIGMFVPEVSFAHPLPDSAAGIGYRDLERTTTALGRDGAAYRDLMKPLVEHISGVVDLTTHGLMRVPRDPVGLLKYGLRSLEQGSVLRTRRFEEQQGPAMIAGLAGHVVGRQPALASAAAGLMLGALSHTVGWPIPTGGSQAIIDAMVADLEAHGGQIVTGHRVTSLAELGSARTVLLDVAAPQLEGLADGRLPSGYAAALRNFKTGDGVSKVDFILSEDVPWADPDVGQAGTVHLGGTRRQVAISEAQVSGGKHPDNPFVLASQPSSFDRSRLPPGSHRQILWTYTHVPAGSTRDMTEAVTAQLERYAPGFADVVVDSKATTAADLERYNPNYVGGDFSAGKMTVPQLLARPVPSMNPWRTPLDGVYLCSASTPPGPAVHGMCGYLAAERALKDVFRLPVPDLGPQ
ncbi:phytoene desaturase family protein [Arthrobacter castelli]|uniref:phytoene desaturase family protein n=1 Tax=Arthrobacter castelli TaxID=271431 RepID=UPI00047DA5CB|nr:NAD(P)/FAD-dependent oxidoreductase [Arthrobacter castelli]